MRVTNDRPSAVRLTAALAAICLLVGRVAAEPLPPPAAASASTACLVEGGYAGMVPHVAATAFAAGGCATASCHGGPAAGNRDVQSFAATLWAERDPHAGAFATLHEPRSRKMAALLGIGEPHRAQQCLACHSTQAEQEEPLPAAVLVDGVSCGSCHGDATDWVAVHHLPEWKQLDAEARGARGYRELADATARVRNCIPCHVGDASREVDHDMIAAGHPRLAFEFTAYQRLWPRHWSPRHKVEATTDFSERSWAVGQAETLAAVARLLEVRARRALESAESTGVDVPAGRWPEFAEFDCYACHRGLSPERVADAAAGPFATAMPGTPAWQPWSVAAARLLAASTDGRSAAATAAAVEELRMAFEAGWAAADRERLEEVITRARAVEFAATQAAAELAASKSIALDASQERLDTMVAADPPGWRFWDAAAQTYLLLDATADGGPARLGVWPEAPPRGDTRAAIDELRAGLRFSPGAGGPDGFDAAAFQRDRAAVPHLRAGPR